MAVNFVLPFLALCFILCVSPVKAGGAAAAAGLSLRMAAGPKSMAGMGSTFSQKMGHGGGALHGTHNLAMASGIHKGVQALHNNNNGPIEPVVNGVKSKKVFTGGKGDLVKLEDLKSQLPSGHEAIKLSEKGIVQAFSKFMADNGLVSEYKREVFARNFLKYLNEEQSIQVGVEHKMDKQKLVEPFFNYCQQKRKGFLHYMKTVAKYELNDLDFYDVLMAKLRDGGHKEAAGYESVPFEEFCDAVAASVTEMKAIHRVEHLLYGEMVEGGAPWQVREEMLEDMIKELREKKMLANYAKENSQLDQDLLEVYKNAEKIQTNAAEKAKKEK